MEEKADSIPDNFISDIIAEMKNQGINLSGEMLIEDCYMGGKTENGIIFIFPFSREIDFALSLSENNERLVEVFSKVRKEKPFVKYIDPFGKIVYEWNNNKERRVGIILQLEKDSNITKIEIIQ